MWRRDLGEGMIIGGLIGLIVLIIGAGGWLLEHWHAW